MKKFFFFLAAKVCLLLPTWAQEAGNKPEPLWELGGDINLYLIPDETFVLPVLRADKNKLHLEARYNYEDFETFSAWLGYNFIGGKKVEYFITPMVGAAVGLTDGVAPGLEFTFTRNRFELYGELEYLFDFESKEYNFLYAWTDLTYTANDWLYFGVSGQRTRLYETDLDIQRGLFLGAARKNWELTTYVYNVGFDDPFVLLTVSVNFEK